MAISPLAAAAATDNPAAMTEADGTPLDATEFACTFLGRIGLDAASLAEAQGIVRSHRLNVVDLGILGMDGLAELGLSSVVDRARIVGAVGSARVTTDPPRIGGQPVQVRVKFGIGLLSSIDTVNQTCVIKTFIDLYWNDPSMVGGDPKHVPSYIWKPDGYIHNVIGGGEKCREHDLVLADPETGLMLCALEFEVTLSNPMDLRAFPFDSDNVQLTFLQSEGSSAADWVCVPHEDIDTSVKCFFDIDALGEFDLKGYSLDFYTSLGGNGVHYTHVDLHLHLVRRPVYYLWKITLPILLTTILSFSSLLFDRDEIADRINTSATMFLTTMALLFVISTDLPKTSFLTNVDVYLTTSMVTQLVVLIESCVVSGALGSLSSSTANAIDHWMLVLLFAGYLGFSAAYFAPKLLRHRRISQSANESPLTIWGYGGGDALQFYGFEVGRNVFF